MFGIEMECVAFIVFFFMATHNYYITLWPLEKNLIWSILFMLRYLKDNQTDMHHSGGLQHVFPGVQNK